MLLKFDLDVKKVQLYAARIVTGLLIITLRTSLYFETGWEPLVNSRDRFKLSKMYKISEGNNSCHDASPNMIFSRTPYISVLPL